MTTNYISLNMLAKEMHKEDTRAKKSQEKDYQRSKRQQFNRVVELLGLDINDYKQEKQCMLGDNTVEYRIPQREKVMFKYWIKNYRATKNIKALEKLEREKRKSNPLEAESISEQIKNIKDDAFIEMGCMIIDEYQDDYEELANIIDILFSKNQYFFIKICEYLHLETSKMIEPIFNNLRGTKSNDIDAYGDENKYIHNYRRDNGEVKFSTISDKESIMLLLMYKDKIEKLGQELYDIIPIVEEINLDRISEEFNTDDQYTDNSLNNVVEAMKQYSDNKSHKDDFTDYDREEIQNLMKKISFW